MTAIRVVAGLGVVAMVGALAYGFATGDFGADGSAILDLAWGRVTLIDLYVGLALIGSWIVVREGSWPRSLPWLVGLVVLGSLAAALYVLIASLRSRDLRQLLLGARV